MNNFKKGDFVINRKDITSITSLLNGKFTFEFTKQGIVHDLNCGEQYRNIKYGDNIITELVDDLILVKCDPELEEK
ncbi:hypothetical protein [Clostridium sp.]|uniref:hypothetical protein n=1 Tax=Clostridium sp. TaxID=1506 RepID=UPI002606B7A1|nr:hypothetical protein [Clostridium sp.]